jgi:hypothetical protein
MSVAFAALTPQGYAVIGDELNWAELSWAELSWAELSWAELSWGGRH